MTSSLSLTHITYLYAMLRRDPKFICKNSTDFKSDSEQITFMQQTKNCKHTVMDYTSGTSAGYFRESIPFSSTTVCSNFSTTGPTVDSGTMTASQMLNLIGNECCKSKTVCYVDFSKLCKTPSKYQPTKTTAKFGSSMTCDTLATTWNSAGNVFDGTDWANVNTCDDITNTIKDGSGNSGSLIARELAAECCEDKVGICADPGLGTENGSNALANLSKSLLLIVSVITYYFL